MDNDAYNHAVGMLFAPFKAREDRETAVHACCTTLTKLFGISQKTAYHLALCAWAELDSSKLHGMFVDLGASTSHLVVIRQNGESDMVFTLAELVQYRQQEIIARMLKRKYARIAGDDTQQTVQ